MFGKASIFLILGYSTIFMIYNANMLSSANKTVDVYTLYYNKTQAQLIASSAANIAGNAMYLSDNWTTAYTRRSYNGGYITITVDTIAGNQRRITAISEYGSAKDTVTIILKPSSFAKFSFYSGQLYNQTRFGTGDTVYGPLHIEGFLYVTGNPVFMGKVTCKQGINYRDRKKDSPKFYGGYESGVSVPLPTNTPDLLSAASSGGKYVTGKDLYLTFIADGNVEWRLGATGSFAKTELTSFSPNGAVYVNNGNCYIKGVLNGKVTIGCSQNIYFADNIVYSKSPETTGCTDMLGLIAGQKFIIPYDATKKLRDYNIQAAMMSLASGLEVEKCTDYGKFIGNINITGALCEKASQQTAKWEWKTDGTSKTAASGYNTKYMSDKRFAEGAPNYFPATEKFEIVSWLE